MLRFDDRMDNTGGRRRPNQANRDQEFADALFNKLYDIIIDIIENDDNEVRTAYKRMMRQGNYSNSECAQLIEDCISYLMVSNEVDFQYGLDQECLRDIRKAADYWVGLDICGWLINSDQRRLTNPMSDAVFEKIEEGNYLRNQWLNRIHKRRNTSRLDNDDYENPRRRSGSAFDKVSGFGRNDRDQIVTGRRNATNFNKPSRRQSSGVSEAAFVGFGDTDDDDVYYAQSPKGRTEPNPQQTRTEVPSRDPRPTETKIVELSKPATKKQPSKFDVFAEKDKIHLKDGSYYVPAFPKYWDIDIPGLSNENKYLSYPFRTVAELFHVIPETGEIKRKFVVMDLNNEVLRLNTLDIEKHLQKEDRFYAIDSDHNQVTAKGNEDNEKVKVKDSNELERLTYEINKPVNDSFEIVQTVQEATLHGLRNHVMSESDITITQVIETCSIAGTKQEETYDKIYAEKLRKCANLTEVYSTLNQCYRDTSMEFFAYYNNNITKFINATLIHLGISGSIDDFSKDYVDMMADIAKCYGDTTLAHFLHQTDGFVESFFKTVEVEEGIEHADQIGVLTFAQEYVVAHVKKSLDNLGILFKGSNKTLEVSSVTQTVLYAFLEKLLNVTLVTEDKPTKVILVTSDKHRLEVRSLYGAVGKSRIIVTLV